MAKRRTQRDVIRELYAKHGRDVDRIVKEVEKAISRGDFRRESNVSNQTLRTYVKFLLDAGLHDRGTPTTGWLLK